MSTEYHLATCMKQAPPRLNTLLKLMFAEARALGHPTQWLSSVIGLMRPLGYGQRAIRTALFRLGEHSFGEDWIMLVNSGGLGAIRYAEARGWRRPSDGCAAQSRRHMLTAMAASLPDHHVYERINQSRSIEREATVQ